jgi:hypothetical protein
MIKMTVCLGDKKKIPLPVPLKGKALGSTLNKYGMKLRILISFIIITVLNLVSDDMLAQSKLNLDCDTIINCNTVRDSLFALPKFEVGDLALRDFLRKNVKHTPNYCGGTEAEAKVYVSLDIDKKGNVFNSKILRISRSGERPNIPELWDWWEKNIDTIYCEGEAKRIVNLLKFIPAKQNGKSYCYNGYIIPIHIEYTANSGD